ncbi:MAG: hypothetical protein JRH20_18975 [Deltaproteobacteria bacterium]|nr:hypothetical protein [Deltaproteobacteria bacterium]
MTEEKKDHPGNEEAQQEHPSTAGESPADVDASKDEGSENLGLEAAWHAAGDQSETLAANADATSPAKQDIDEVDPDLMHLPRRRRRRHPVISALVIVLAGYLMVFNGSDFAYFFASSPPIDLGEVTEVIEQPEKLRVNRYVSLRGAPDRKHALLIQGRISGYDSFFRLRGGRERVFVQRHRTKRSSGRAISAVHTGRLVRFASLSYHQSIRDYFAKNTSVAHDFDFDTLQKAKTGDTVMDKSGLQLKLEDSKLFWINVTYPDEWLIQFSKQIYPDQATAAKELEGINVPFAAEEEPSKMFWRFVVITAGKDAKQLMARFGAAKKNTGFLRRQVSYSARYDQLRFEKDALVITAKDETFPSRYGARKEGETTRLVPLKVTPVRIPKVAVLYTTASSKFNIPDDAVVLIAGTVPKDKWLYLLLYLLLGGFVVFNVMALINRARGR